MPITVDLNPGTDWRWESAHPECYPYGRLQTRWTLYKNGKVVDRLDEPILLPGLRDLEPDLVSTSLMSK